MKNVIPLVLSFLLLSLKSLATEPSAMPIKILAGELPPYSYTENGKNKGINLEPFIIAARNRNIPLEIEFLPWKRAQKIMENQPGVFLITLARIPYREKLYRWVAPLSQINLGFMSFKKLNSEIDYTHMPPSSQGQNIPSDSRVCVHTQTPMLRWIRDSIYSNYTEASTEDICLKFLQTGRADYWFTDEKLARHLVEESGGDPDDLIFHQRIMKPLLYLTTSLKTPEEQVETMKELLASSDLAKQSLFFSEQLNIF